MLTTFDSVSGTTRRRTSRVRVYLQARYLSASLNIEGRVTDVSSDGLFFCSDYLDDAGETARLWIDLPSGGRLELCGEVRWVRETPNAGGMGIRFTSLSVHDRALLRGLTDASAAGEPAGPVVGVA